MTENEVSGVTPKKHISSKGLNASATKLIPEYSIAIITRVGVGKLAFIPFLYASSQDFLSLSKLKTNGLFTVYALYKKLRSELNVVQGTSIKGITKEELLAKTIMIPSISEQAQIGAFFTVLDRLITLHQRAPCEHQIQGVPYAGSNQELRALQSILRALDTGLQGRSD